jgi:G-patch domain
MSTTTTTSTTTTSVQSEFAKRQLERMGWSEGNGLGKDRQGRATPIIVKRRSDATGGLGIEKEKVRQTQQTIQDEWWKDALGDTLCKLRNKKEKKKKKKRKSNKDDNGDESDETTNTNIYKKIVYTDEELFIATGGARFGMRAGKTRNQAKWRRTEQQETKLLTEELQQQKQPQQQSKDDAEPPWTDTDVVITTIENPNTKSNQDTSEPIITDETQTRTIAIMNSKIGKKKETKLKGEKNQKVIGSKNREKTKKRTTTTSEKIVFQKEVNEFTNDINVTSQDERRKKKKKDITR